MKTYLAIALGLLLGLGFNAQALADTTTPATGESKEEKPAHKEDVGKTSGLKRYDLGLWTLIVFGLLLLLLSKTAWKPIMQGLEKRENNIAAFHTEAEKAKAEAEKLLAEIKSQRAQVAGEVVEILAEARRDADRYRESEKARSAADLQADRDRLKREIETARDQALKEIWEKTVELSTLVSSKAIGRSVNADDHRRLIDESLGELNELIASKA